MIPIMFVVNNSYLSFLHYKYFMQVFGISPCLDPILHATICTSAVLRLECSLDCLSAPTL